MKYHCKIVSENGNKGGINVLGERLRRLRVNSFMSVKELAARVGVSPNFIYQVEKGKVSPSYSTLEAMAQALNVNLGALLDSELPEEWHVVRQSGRKRLVTEQPGLEIELINFLGPRNKRMQPVIFSVDPHAQISGFIYEHEREDLIYVLEGTLELRTKKHTYLLSEGDFAYFIFYSPETIFNPGDAVATGIWVVSPPDIYKKSE